MMHSKTCLTGSWIAAWLLVLCFIVNTNRRKRRALWCLCFSRVLWGLRTDCTSLLCSSLCSSSSCSKAAAVLRSAASDCSRSTTLRASPSSRRDNWAPCEATQEAVTLQQEETLRSRSAKSVTKTLTAPTAWMSAQKYNLTFIVQHLSNFKCFNFFPTPPTTNLETKKRIRHNHLIQVCQTVAPKALQNHY